MAKKWRTPITSKWKGSNVGRQQASTLTYMQHLKSPTYTTYINLHVAPSFIRFTQKFIYMQHLHSPTCCTYIHLHVAPTFTYMQHLHSSYSLIHSSTCSTYIHLYVAPTFTYVLHLHSPTCSTYIHQIPSYIHLHVAPTFTSCCTYIHLHVVHTVHTNRFVCHEPRRALIEVNFQGSFGKLEIDCLRQNQKACQSFLAIPGFRFCQKNMLSRYLLRRFSYPQKSSLCQLQWQSGKVIVIAAMAYVVLVSVSQRSWHYSSTILWWFRTLVIIGRKEGYSWSSFKNAHIIENRATLFPSPGCLERQVLL